MTIRRPAPPAPTYIGPPAHHGDNDNKPIDHVTIHSTVSPCVEGGARATARYFQQTDRDASAHYCADPGEVIQAAFDSLVCYHAPPNQHSLGVEMCDMPGPVPGMSRASALWHKLRRSWRWAKPNQRRMLRRTARLVGELCAAYAVPPRFLSAADLRAGHRGVTTHANVSKAFGQSTHWDPGWWPRRRFMKLVRAAYADAMTKAARHR